VAEPPKSEPSIMDTVWEKVSSHLGASGETVQKIKFGRGVVGKISVITVSAFAAIAAMAVRLGANAVYVGIGVVGLIALASFGLIILIVCKTPQLAVLEGAELVMYQHVTLQAKGTPPYLGDSAPAIPPDIPSPQISDGSPSEGTDA
jgi:hypothetical protein